MQARAFYEGARLGAPLRTVPVHLHLTMSGEDARSQRRRMLAGDLSTPSTPELTCARRTRAATMVRAFQHPL